ncbi:phage Gp37/Gp68 family protein [Cupriavidus sp. CV2]|uniref:phage Gp37/Gp68 family protein n=1 Tax=Cupriavidus ulmosensis TaxID=3065913 RepID=UPI00296B294F|nr:phage Gp37/Gp68 family protein [Cupriavidus sp. CV2]MDW3683354.1 phage Gp37/Gp68 family protein [Cupriavidus sp. CV2]
MSETTKIEWTDATFNPWIGCTKVSPACDHCYAEVSTPARALGVSWGTKEDRHRTSAANWKQALRWNARHEEFFAAHGRRRRVFCASLADVFDNAVDPGWRADLFRLIEQTPNLDWLLLTKPIGNARAMSQVAMGAIGCIHKPLPENVWLGTTICNQEEADRDIPKLLAVPARVRFLSMEPLLGPVDLSYWIAPTVHCGACGDYYPPSEAIPDPSGHKMGADKCARCGAESCMGTWWGEEAIEERSRPDGMELDLWDHGYRLDWVIVGGESGASARPMHPDWARSLRDQCEAAGVPFLFKQWGEWLGAGQDGNHNHDPIELNASDVPVRVGKKAAGRLLDGVQHDGSPEPAL